MSGLGSDGKGETEKVSFGTSAASIHMCMHASERSVFDMKAGPRCGGASTMRRRMRVNLN